MPPLRDERQREARRETGESNELERPGATRLERLGEAHVAAEHHARERVVAEERAHAAVLLDRTREIHGTEIRDAPEDDEGVRQDMREFVHASRERVETHRADEIERHGAARRTQQARVLDARDALY